MATETGPILKNRHAAALKNKEQRRAVKVLRREELPAHLIDAENLSGWNLPLHYRSSRLSCDSVHHDGTNGCLSCLGVDYATE